jgi:Mn-dependent DtxR family transcriptional regulator
MTTHVDEQPLLIATFDLFRDHQSYTLPTIVDELNVSESAALAALERLEHLDVLVRARAGTGTPVWKRHPEAETSRLVRPEGDRPTS